MGVALCRATDGRHKNVALRAARSWPAMLKSTFAYARTVLGRVNGELRELDCYIWPKEYNPRLSEHGIPESAW